MPQKIRREQITDAFPVLGTVTFQNSWADYDDTHPGNEYGPVGYYKDAMGVVYLRGLIFGGTASQVAFTLPAGYRPDFRHIFTRLTAANSTLGRVDVLPSGQVLPYPGTSWVTLAGISFIAQQ